MRRTEEDKGSLWVVLLHPASEDAGSEEGAQLTQAVGRGGRRERIVGRLQHTLLLL